MLDVEYAPRFLREYHTLEPRLQEEVREKVALFNDPKSHRHLKVHPLRGRMKGRWSFSVNYKYRIVFKYIGKGKKHAALLSVSDHATYD